MKTIIKALSKLKENGNVRILRRSDVDYYCKSLELTLDEKGKLSAKKGIEEYVHYLEAIEEDEKPTNSSMKPVETEKEIYELLLTLILKKFTREYFECKVTSDISKTNTEYKLPTKLMEMLKLTSIEILINSEAIIKEKEKISKQVDELLSRFENQNDNRTLENIEILLSAAKLSITNTQESEFETR